LNLCQSYQSTTILYLEVGGNIKQRMECENEKNLVGHTC